MAYLAKPTVFQLNVRAVWGDSARALDTVSSAREKRGLINNGVKLMTASVYLLLSH